MPDIFLSYTREDQATAQRFAEGFEAQGFTVWWDATLRSGEAYDQVTEEALRTAKAVVVLWSKKSVGSRWVRAEATLADRNRTLVPAMIEPCERPIMFELTQASELSHWRGQADDKAWLAFLDDLRRKVGSSAAEPVKTAAGSAPAAGLTGNGPPYVAVLPLTHRGGDAGLDVLAEDLTEEITRELAPSSFFHVIAPATMAAWRGRPTDPRAVRQELDAAYLVEGKLQRVDETLRLSVQLIETSTGGMLKSERFSRKLDEIMASPEDFAIAVAVQLGEQIERIETDRAMARSGPLSGWEHLLRAVAFGSSRFAGSRGRTILEDARRALAAMPDLGLAHAVLAFALTAPAAGQGGEIDPGLSQEIQTHARRAMQLDGDNPAVITQLIPSYALLGDGDFCSGLAQRAVELAPNSPRSLFWLGVTHAGLGRTAEAISVITKYERLTSLDRSRPTALYTLGMCHFLEGRPDEADAALDRALALDPDFDLALKWKAVVAADRGEEKYAIAAVRRLREVVPALSIEAHVRQMIRLRQLGERGDQAAAILRRVWAAVDAAG